MLNKVTEENRDFMLDAVADRDAVAACIPLSQKILKAGLCGQELTERAPEVEELAEKLLQ